MHEPADPSPERRPSPARRPRRSRAARTLALLTGLGLLAAACGEESADPPATGGGGPTGSDAPVNAPRAGAVASIDQAQTATIQIIAQGSFRDPEVGMATGAGSGSGFFIAPDGLAVTNQHVVTGAATLEVFVGGDTTKSYNASVVGVSECNDLALIKADVDGDVPFFEWYNGEIRAGLDVYAAGYPLGDPEFTLTKGIVAKAKAGGDLTGTSSIDHTIEHDANIQPGNSGGPLLTPDGRVAGVNYAGGASATTTAQFYAIASTLARDVVDELHQGDFESLGINGWAVSDDAAGVAGIWVAGVEPGSPAAKAKVVPGDIIRTMNGLPIGQDGTFKDYCDVIRTAAGARPIAVDVLRWDTQELLRGELNGEDPLEVAFSFAQEVRSETGVATAQAYSRYVPVTDDTGLLTVEVPAEWAEVTTTPESDGQGGSFAQIAASTDLDGFFSRWDTPGMLFAALPASAWSPEQLLETYSFAEACADGGTHAYQDGVFTGSFKLWEDCGGTENDYVVLATSPVAGGDHTYLTTVQVVTSADLEALDHVFATFNVTG